MRDRKGASLRVALPHGLVAAVCAVAAHWAAFRGFADYDDEGYLLLSLRSFRDGADLYGDLYAQYGPFFFEFWGGLSALTGVEPTTDSSRFAVVAVWTVAPLLLGLATFALTRRLAVSLGAQAVAFLALQSLEREPMHPGGLSVLLLAAMVAVAAVAGPRGRGAFAALGALGAALALVKINVGGLALIAALAAVLMAEAGAWARRPRLVLEVAIVCLPALVIRPDLGEGWGRHLAALIALGTLAVVLAARRRAPVTPAPGAARAVALVAGAAAATVAILAAALAVGSTPGGLVEGIFTVPLGQRGAYTRPFPVPSLTGVLALVAVAGLVALLALARPARPSALAAGVAIAGGALTWASLAELIPATPDGNLSLELPVLLAWTALVARPEPGRPGGFAAVFVPLAAVLGALQVYPVSGSQVGFAAPLFAVAGGMALAGGASELTAWARERGEGALDATRLGVRYAALLAAALALTGIALRAAADRDEYRAAVPARLAGAERVRLDRAEAERLRRLTAEIRRRCGTLVTLPGMLSLNLWSGVRPPTAMNATSWMYLFDDERQQRIVRALERAPRPCLVRNRGQVDFWRQGRPLPSRPLLRYVDSRFVPKLRVGGYELLLPS